MMPKPYRISDMTSRSSNNKVLLQPVYVIHARPYRDTSLLVDLFSSNHGLIKVVARSARGARSRFQGKLQPFVPLLASWSGRNELKSLSYLELRGLPAALCGSRLACGFYMNELLSRLLHREDPYPLLFSYYQETLQQLQCHTTISATLRYFEVRLLHELGYGLSLEYEAKTGAPIVPGKSYSYIFQHGFCQDSSSVSDNSVLGESLIALRQEMLLEEVHLREIKYLMRNILSHYLGDKPLSSRELF